jgi:hypothetical protein
MSQIINAEWEIMLNGKKRQLEITSYIISADCNIISNGKKNTIALVNNFKNIPIFLYKNLMLFPTFCAFVDVFPFDILSSRLFIINERFIHVGVFSSRRYSQSTFSTFQRFVPVDIFSL